MANNSQTGLQTHGLQRVEIKDSLFVGNTFSGFDARDTNHIEISGSLFQENRRGIQIDRSESVTLEYTNSVRNGDNPNSSTQAGLSVRRVDVVNVTGGHFSSNFGDGIVGEEIGSAKFHGINASGNRRSGVSIRAVAELENHDGNFYQNRRNGFDLTSRSVDLRTNVDVAFYGGWFAENDIGFAARSVQDLVLKDVLVENNYSGLSVNASDNVGINGSYFSNNEFIGLRIVDVDRVKIIDVVADSNVIGLAADRGRHWTVANSWFKGGDWGVIASGITSRLDFKNVVAIENVVGASISDTTMFKIRDGHFSNNQSDAIRINNVPTTIAYRAFARNNGGHGVAASTGQSASLQFVGGLFQGNGANGIDVRTTTDQASQLNFWATDVVALGNTGSGVNLALRSPMGETSRANIQFERGYYARNGQHGIAWSGDVVTACDRHCRVALCCF